MDVAPPFRRAAQRAVRLPTWADVGLRRPAWFALGIQLCLALLLLVGLRIVRLQVAWGTAASLLVLIAGFLAIWSYYTWTRGSAWEWWLAEVCLAYALLTALGLWAGPLQYMAVGWGRPLADPWLAATDAALGVSVKTWAGWLGAHPSLDLWLHRAYVSLMWQFLLVVPLMGLYRDRLALWEYVTLFHVCTILTVLACAAWPAAGAFQYLGFTSTLPQDHFLEQFAATRAGTIGMLDYGNLEGLVSFPSFHVAGGWMVTWVLRRHWIVWPLAVLNLALAASAVVSGAHYLTDALGTLGMGAIAVVVSRWVLLSAAPAFSERGLTSGSQLPVA